MAVPYTITLTNGSTLTIVSPGNSVGTVAAVTLIGQNDINYGTQLNENFVHLLENYANTVPPQITANGSTVPLPVLTGQLWYDTSTNYIRLYSREGGLSSTPTWFALASQLWVENYVTTYGTVTGVSESWVEAYVTSQNFVTQTYLNNQGFLTSNQTITLSGDVTGSGTTAITATLSASGVSSGTYTKVQVDTKGRVQVGSQFVAQDVINALGYVPASVSGSSGQTEFQYGALNSTNGTVLNYLAMQSTNTNNNILQFYELRFAAGNDSTTASTRIQNITDVSAQGYIEFNPQSHPYGVGIGANNAMQLVAMNQTIGGSSVAGVAINTNLYMVGDSGNDPVINFQTGSLNNNNSGFSSQTTVGKITFNQTFSALLLSSNSDGSNSVAIFDNGLLGANGVSSGTDMTLYSGVTFSSAGNLLKYNTSGIFTLTPSTSTASVFGVDASGNVSANGFLRSAYGNIYLLTPSDNNANIWVNDENDANIGLLWFDNEDSVPYSWRMTAQNTNVGAINQLNYFEDGRLIVNGGNSNEANTGSGGMQIYSSESDANPINSLTLIANGQYRVVFDGYTQINQSSFPGSISGTVLTVPNGQPNYGLAVGQVISGSGVTNGTQIVSLGTGTGGSGTYNLNVSGSVSQENLYSLTINSVPGTINFYHGQGNYGDGNITNNGQRRRTSMQEDGNFVVYDLQDVPLWSADTASSSDLRLKENIDFYEDGLNFVLQLNPVIYNYTKESGLHDGKKHVGFIAQELEEIDNHDAVTSHGRHNYRIVHKQNFVPHLVSAVQTLATENDNLKARVQKLEDFIENLLKSKV